MGLLPIHNNSHTHSLVSRIRPIAILVADEYASSLQVIDQLISNRAENVIVYLAQTAKRRAELCLQHKIDIIITSLFEPAFFTINFINETRLNNINTHFIVVSEEGIITENCVADMPNTFLLHKPLYLTELFEALRHSIAEIELGHRR